MKLQFILRDGQRILQEWQEGDCDMGRWNDVPLVVAPPAPEPVRRWECNVTLIGTDTDFCYPAMHGEIGGHKHERAHVHVGFDAQGRVWFADDGARRLAKYLRTRAAVDGSALFNQAADRLAGPEPDAT